MNSVINHAEAPAGDQSFRPIGHTSSNSAKSQPTGFTLVELLAVIAIIGVLAAISISVISRMRHAAQTTQSLSNLRQIHVLMQNYLNENKRVYPAAIAPRSVYEDQAGYGIYWRRLIWEASYGSRGSYWDPAFPSDAYNKVMWCPVMESKYGKVDFKEGHGSYALHKFFHYWEWPMGDTSRTRNALNMTDMGRKTPYVFTGNAATDSPEIGTAPYGESSAYPYGTRWYNLAYEYGASRNMAIGLFLDGSVRMIDQATGTQMNNLFMEQETLP